MGLFDSVYFGCPNGCEEANGVDVELEVQSKAGECTLASFSPRAVPMAIAADIDGEQVYCYLCKTTWVVRPERLITKTIPMVLEER